MTLTEFLLARIAEDEALAKSCATPHWRSWVEGRDGRGGDDALLMNAVPTEHVAMFDVDMLGVYGWPDYFSQDHAARHDPARVLAECEAKRRIVDLHSSSGNDGCDLCNAPRPCDTLRLLASVYGDHPDYDEAWRA